MNARLCASLATLLLALHCATSHSAESAPAKEPPIIHPGPPPSDAIVLFDGRDLSKWRSANGGPAQWEVKDGIAIVTKTGSIMTTQSFGDCQLHVEWAPPLEIKGDGQGRGNSGIYLQNRYELQVLDSYQNSTYPDGQAGAIYKQYPPLVNASREPTQWQSFDIIFRAPRFDEKGALLKPAIMTVLHNGVLIHDHVEVKGPTAPAAPATYKAHPPKEPLLLQDHKNPVRYRSLWIREL